MVKKHSTLLSCLILLLILLCIGAALAGGALVGLPTLADRALGPPTSGLGLRQRTYLSALLLLHKSELTRPKDPAGADQPFQVQLGESPREIANQLQSEGLISDADTFRSYLVYSGLDTTLQAGKYSLSARMTPLEIAHTLQDATPTEVILNILPGWRMEEIAATLPTSGLSITPLEFDQAASQQPSGNTFLKSLPPKATLEGFLFPGSYTLARSATAEQLISTLLKNFEANVGSDILQGFRRQGLDLYEGVTLASMVQREAIVPEEMPLIASVFLNRQSANMKLDSDPTVQYALGYNSDQKTWWTNPLSLDNLQVNSPYNTYQRAGLPAGPISNPGLNALQAVAFPAQTPYYYFRAACDGSGRHTFAKTFEEHVKNACP